MSKRPEPKGTTPLVEVFRRFPTQQACLDHLEKVRWSGTPVCPYCNSTRSTPAKSGSRHHCNNCNTSYSVTVRTIFHQTRLPLQKWLLALSLILNAKKGIAARQLARDLEVHRNTAWRISMQIRKAMNESAQRNLLSGIVEMDETYVGGKPRGKVPGGHKRGRGTKKIPVVGIVERGGRVVARVFKKDQVRFKKFKELVRETVDTTKASLMTDGLSAYKKMHTILPHDSIDHNKWYVDGDIHTQTIESFWAVLKRGIVGQFHKVSVKHLPAYVNEFTYRFSRRFAPENMFDETIRRGLGVI